MRTTTYRAPDKRRGYTGGEIAAILSRHHPAANVIARVGWKGQVQQLVVDDPETPELDPERVAEVEQWRDPNLQRRIDGLPECETPPPPPPGAHPEYVRTDPMRTVADAQLLHELSERTESARLQGSLDATDDEEWLREQLRERGVPVHVVEAVARRGMYMDHEHGRAELAAHGIDLAVIDEVAHKYRELVRRRDSARKLDGGTR